MALAINIEDLQNKQRIESYRTGFKKGYLQISVYDDGKIDGMKVDDALLKRINGICSDGNILSLSVMNTEKVQTDEGVLLIKEKL